MSYDSAPLSKTAKYKKITKPLLERKRRARINRCLDELKDLMVGALEIDDDNLSKLEKADILELTVDHLTKLHSQSDPVVEAKKFQAGFGQCAAEACRFIMSVPDLDANVSQNLIGHLSTLITSQPLSIQVPERPQLSPPVSPTSIVSDRQHYYSDQDRSSSDAEESVYLDDNASRRWANSRQDFRPSRKPSPPMAGLLTTVDKLQTNYTNSSSSNQRNGPYFNRVPAEAKDIILQKIRQHIMDKRGNENMSNGHMNMCNGSLPESKYLHRDESYRNEYIYQYQTQTPPLPSNDSLDLRKVRSPPKPFYESSHSEKQAEFLNNYQRQLDMAPSECKVNLSPKEEIKAEVASPSVNVPKQCELPMDYSNLPPKKKRKLIEYQEYKKQEEAKRQVDALKAEKKVKIGPPSSEWRPW